MAKIYEKLPDVEYIIVSQYGKDFLQHFHGNNLYPTSPTSSKTLVYENMTVKSGRTQKAFNRDMSNEVEIDHELRKHIKSADVIIFSPLLPNYSAEYIGKVKSLVQKDAPFALLPQGYFRKFDAKNNVLIQEFLKSSEVPPFFDIVVISEEDHNSIESIISDWKQYVKVLVVTRGSQGADAITHEKRMTIPTKKSYA